MQRRVRVPLWTVMAAIGVAAIVLLIVKPYWPGWVARYERWQRDRVVHAQLERPISLRYPAGVAMEGLLLAVSDSTRSEGLPSGLTIYVDELALQAAGARMKSPVTIDVEDVPLKTALHSALGQYGLEYRVVDGALIVTGPGGRY